MTDSLQKITVLAATCGMHGDDCQSCKHAKAANDSLLRAERDRIDALERALEPFARYAELNDLDERRPDDAIEVPIRDLLNARTLLNKKEQG